MRLDSLRALFDTHCHLDFSCFGDDFAAQLGMCHQAGVAKLILPSIGPSNWPRVSDLCSAYAGIYFALGLHPFFLKQNSLEVLTDLADRLNTRSDKCVAIGECGLDSMIDVDHILQERCFAFQIDLAMQHKLPLIIHSRKTHTRVIAMCKHHQFEGTGVIHAFSGSYEQAKQFIDLGFKLGVGGGVTYLRANKTRNAIARLPLNCLVLETDAPDMPINGQQGELNHPQYLPQIFNQLALLRHEQPGILAKTIWDNSCQLFGIESD
jgi:TatD DNase family protein